MDPMTLSTMAQLLGPIASTLMQQDEPIKNPHLFRKQFRLGGTVMDPREAELPMHKVEVEDEEVIQPPTGNAVEVRGNTHEEGGIPMDLEQGTVVYSSKLKGPDGRTMADRKKRRDQLLEKLAKQLKDSKADSIHRATIERAMETTLLEDMSDVTVMQQAFLKEQGGEEVGEEVKAQTGMVVGPTPQTGVGKLTNKKRRVLDGYSWDYEFDPYNFQMAMFPDDKSQWDNVVGPKTSEAIGTPEGKEMLDILGRMQKGESVNMVEGLTPQQGEPQTNRGINPNDFPFDHTQLTDIDLINADFDGFTGEPNPRTLTADKLNPSLVSEPDPYSDYTFDPDAEGVGAKTRGEGSISDYTAGDIASVAGPIGKTLTTIFNRLGDRPTPNYMQNVGAQQEALQAQGQRGLAEARDLEMQRNNRMLNALRFKNQARGAGTQRAMDLGALTAAGETQSRISSRFQQLLNQQLQQMGQTATQNERMRAEGRKFADITDTQNRDNFATQLGTNIGDVGRGVQHMEKNRNRRALAERFQGADAESVIMSLLQGISR
jgi:hypothetical protein